MPTVLLITSDSSADELIRESLGNLGYEVVRASNGETAIRSLFTVKVDAVVADTILGENLGELRLRLREVDEALPVVFLSAASSRWLPGSLPLRAGLDEVAIKPCSAEGVRQALERALAASHRARPSVMIVGDVELDRITQEMKGNGVQVQLTPTEFKLIEYLVQRQGAVVSSDELLEKVWSFHPGTGSPELVRSHVRNLRAKVRIAAAGRDLIQTVPRRGYRIDIISTREGGILS